MTTPLLTAWSYSRYADYTRCPLYFKLKYLDKSLVDEGNAAMNRGSLVHKDAEDYTLGRTKKMPDSLKNFKDEFTQLRSSTSVMVEQNWGFRSNWQWTGRPGWFGDDVWLRVKADAFVPYEDDTALLIDHKTGRKYGVNEEQVELFGAVAFMRLPTLRSIDIRLWYLDLTGPESEDTFEMTAEEAAAIRKKWEKKVRPMFNDRRFAPKPNDRCKWCPASNANGGKCKF